MAAGHKTHALQILADQQAFLTSQCRSLIKDLSGFRQGPRAIRKIISSADDLVGEVARICRNMASDREKFRGICQKPPGFPFWTIPVLNKLLTMPRDEMLEKNPCRAERIFLKGWRNPEYISSFHILWFRILLQCRLEITSAVSAGMVIFLARTAGKSTAWNLYEPSFFGYSNRKMAKDLATCQLRSSGRKSCFSRRWPGPSDESGFTQARKKRGILSLHGADGTPINPDKCYRLMAGIRKMFTGRIWFQPLPT